MHLRWPVNVYDVMRLLFFAVYNEESKGMSTGAIVGLCLGILGFVGIVVGAVCGVYLWRNRDKELASKVTQRAGMVLIKLHGPSST